MVGICKIAYFSSHSVFFFALYHTELPELSSSATWSWRTPLGTVRMGWGRSRGSETQVGAVEPGTGCLGLQQQAINCFSNGEKLLGRRKSPQGQCCVSGKGCQWLLEKFIGSSWLYCNSHQLLVNPHLLSGLHSKLAARSHLAKKLEDHNQVYIVASKCKEIINGCIYFLVIRGSRCRYLFFTFSRGSMDPTSIPPHAGSGRPLNFPGVHLPTCGLKSIYNPNLAYSAPMSLSVWWASRYTWRPPYHSRHLHSKSCESWSSSEVKSDMGEKTKMAS